MDLILGGTGFVGSALLQQLQKDNTTLHALYHRTPPSDSGGLKTGFGENEKQHSSHVPRIHWYQGSVTRFDWNRFSETVPERVFHVARIAGRSRFSRILAGFRGRQANRRLIGWLKMQDNKPLLVYISGSLVYGNCGLKPVDENAPLKPISFQRQYVRAEYPVLSAFHDRSLPVVIIRPPWIYGPGSWFKQFYHNHIRMYNEVPAFGDGSQLMSLIHVQDLAGLIRHICESVQSGGELNHATPLIVNACSHTGMRHDDFVQMLSEIYDKPVRWYSGKALRKKFGYAVSEALTFSLQLDTIHHRIYSEHQFFYPDLKDGLRNVIEELNNQ